eukprot:gene4314-23215_t
MAVYVLHEGHISHCIAKRIILHSGCAELNTKHVHAEFANDSTTH